ncbi:MAG: PAS domain-containing protein [Spirosomaceae bacterium]|jgi:PAS domain S-box-containing protein|nr:PAS domain-containing protein [Spirosomataceae bacterium]
MNYNRAYADLLKEAYNVERPMPLLCWDIANPFYERRQNIAQDLLDFERLKTTFNWDFPQDIGPLLRENNSFVVTNLARQIVWVSKGFEQMTGYTQKEIEGKKPGMLQGQKTNAKTSAFVRSRIEQLEAVKFRILNYRKNNDEYWCCIEVKPLRTLTGEITHFLAIEKEEI